jgi:WD40 repeat protein
MSSIFLSHSSKDNAIAGQLKTCLTEWGHRSVFLDFDPADGIPMGRDWEKELYARLRECRAVILLCSHASMASRWCFAEITHAKALGKPVLPIKIDDCQVDSLLTGVQIIDATAGWDPVYQRLANGLLAAGLDPKDLFDWDSSRPPYPGLLAFQERDAAIFFGRDKEIREAQALLNRLQQFGGPRLTMMLGASGSGKSSLLRAGLLPRLRRDRRWLVLEPFRPLNTPFDELARVVSTRFDLVSKSKGGGRTDSEHIRDSIRWRDDKDPNCMASFAEVMKDLRETVGVREGTVLVIIDQFEELLGFGFNEEGNHFLAFLRSVLDQGDSRLMFLGTLRSDFLSSFQDHPAMRGLTVEIFPVRQMDVEDFGPVIEGPARIAGLQLGSGLVQALVSDTKTSDALPLLAFTLRELWEGFGDDRLLTLEEYRAELGGLEGSIARAAEAVINAKLLNEKEIAELRTAFLALVRLNDNDKEQYARQPAQWKDLPAGVYEVLERFVTARLLVSSGDENNRTLEVAHEALFRAWPRLEGWLKDNKRFLAWRKRFEEAAQHWEYKQVYQYHQDLLLRPGPLAEAEDWILRQPIQLTSAQKNFLHESVKLRERAERRRRVITLASLAAAVVFLVMAGLAGLQWINAKEQRQVASARQLAAQAQLIRNQSDYLLPRSVLLAIESMRLMPSLEGDDVLRSGVALLPKLRLSVRHEDNATAISFSPDGKYLATASWDHTIRVWDAVTGEEVFRTDSAQNIWNVAFSPNGKYLAAARYDKIVPLWEVPTGRETIRLVHEANVRAVSFSPDGKYLATASWDHTARVWEVANGREVARMVHEDSVSAIAFSWDGEFIVTGSDDKTSRVWKTHSGHEIMRLFHPDKVFTVAISQNTKYLITATRDNTVWVWDRATGRAVTSLKHDKLWAVAVSPDSEYIATTSGDRTLQLWRTTTGQEVMRMMQQGIIRKVTFSPDGKFLATASDDQTGRVWDVRSGREIMRLVHQDKVETIAFASDGRYVGTASEDDTARVWEVTSAPEVARVVHDDSVSNVRFSPDGRYLATGSADKTARVWEVATGREITRIEQPQLEAISFSPKMSYLATASFDGTARLWDIKSGREVMRLSHEGKVYDVDFSRDGKYVFTGSQAGPTTSSINARIWKLADGSAVGGIGYDRDIVAVEMSEDQHYLATASGQLFSQDKVARIWDLRNGQEVMRLAHEDSVADVAFSPDGRYLGTASYDTTARLWETSTGKEVARFKHEYWALKIVFSSDGKYLATAALDGAYVWEPLSGRKIVRIAAIAEPILDVAFSPDRKYLATASEDKTASVWYLWPQDLIREACARLTHNLTPEEWREYMGEQAYRQTCPHINLPR